MAHIHISQDILPLGVFKAQASRVLRRVREEGRPIVITQNGRPAAVLLSPEEFDRLTERESFMTAVTTGLADVEAGRILDDNDIARELADRFPSSDST